MNNSAAQKICLAVSLSVLALAGCSKARTSRQGTQVVATVNDREITTKQLNQVLQAANVTAVTPEVKKQAIDSLVSEELLVQDAVKSKLDRDPAVVQQIERSRRQILAQAYAERRLFARAQPTDREIEDYYKKNPALFSSRKVYRFTTFSARKNDIVGPVRAELDSAHSVDQVRGVLDKHSIRYATQLVTVTPEQLPIERVAAFASANVGDLLLTEEPDNQELLMSLTAAEDSPLAIEQASPLIRQYLVNSWRKEAMDAYLAQTRAAAKIAYTPEPEQHAQTGQPAAQAYAELN